MRQLFIQQQSITSWAAYDCETRVQLGWITQVENTLGKSNASFQVVHRADISHEFNLDTGFESLDIAISLLQDLFVEDDRMNDFLQGLVDQDSSSKEVKQ